MDAKRLFPGKEILGESYTSIGTAEEPMLAALVIYRKPASGLDQQKYITVLAAIDPTKLTVLRQTEVDEDDYQGNTMSVTGSNGPAVAFTLEKKVPGSTFDTAYTTYGYDATTGTKIWEQPGYGTGAVFGAIVVEGSGKGIIPYTDEPCPRATGVDIVSGKILYAVDYMDISDRCNDVDLGHSAGSGFSPGQAEFLQYVRITEAGVQKSFNALTGQAVTLQEQTLAVDPRSTFVAGEVASGQTQPLVVTDAATGETKWTLEAARVAKLNASVLSLYAGKLYLKTTDQQPVVDIATGTTIIDNATRYPVGPVDDWTYWSDGTLDKTTQP